MCDEAQWAMDRFERERVAVLGRLICARKAGNPEAEPEVWVDDSAVDVTVTVDGDSSTCPNPAPSFATEFPGSNLPSHKRRHRRGHRPRSGKNVTQAGGDIPTDATFTGCETLQEEVIRWHSQQF